MSYEVRIGLLAAIAITVAIWGYKFMRGKNLLNASNIYYVQYTDIDELTATAPVMIRGLRVGTVTHVRLNDDMRSITATLDIDKDIRLHVNTQAVIVSTGIMGGRAVVLQVDQACSGDDCVKSGSYLEGRVQGLFESMLGGAEAHEFVTKIKAAVVDIIATIDDSLSNPNSTSTIVRSFQDLQVIMNNLAGITSQLNSSMDVYDERLVSTLNNIEILTATLAENSTKINTTLDNLEVITSDFRESALGTRAAQTMDQADEAVATMQQTIEQTSAAVSQLEALLSDVQAGKGTLGLLAKDPELYNNLKSTARNLDLLLQDFRLNPKRYVNVSVFGKKQKDYVVPENDPAEPAGKN